MYVLTRLFLLVIAVFVVIQCVFAVHCGGVDVGVTERFASKTPVRAEGVVPWGLESGFDYTPVVDPVAVAGMYANDRPINLVTPGSLRLPTDIGGRAITNGKSNRTPWTTDTAVKLGNIPYSKSNRRQMADSGTDTLGDMFVATTTDTHTPIVIGNMPNTPDEFMEISHEVPRHMSSFAPSTQKNINGCELIQAYRTKVVNTDDTDGRICHANLNKGFKNIQSRVLSAQSKVEKFRPLHEEHMRTFDSTSWMDIDNPIM